QRPRLESIWADVKFALRQLRRSPGFAVTAILTLALGIGANTAIFTLIDSIMLRPLPYPQQERLMRISGTDEQGRPSAADFPKGWIRAWQGHSQSFESISGYASNAESNVTGNDESERVFGTAVTVNTFDTLGIHPAIGSFFSPENAGGGQDLVVVLSYGYWRQRFAGNPGVIGETVRIDGISRRIIGVMPPGVRFPYADTQFLVPIAFKGGDPIDAWKDFGNRAFGRLKDGVSPAAAQAELRRLHTPLLKLFPWTMPDSWEANTDVVPLLDSVVGDTRPRLLLLFGAVGLILLIACANVANLMLARATSREREMAIRGALGASATRIVRQLLVESVILGAMAGAVGLVLAAVSLRALTGLLPADTPRLADIALHWPVFLFASGASVLTGIVFGLVPAIRMASPDLQEGLRSGSRSVAGKASQARISTLLVVGQIGLSVLVITAAGLMLHSLYSLSRVNPGFRTDRIVTAEVALDATACRTQGRCQGFFRELVEKAQGIAGVENMALVDSLPMSSGYDLNYPFDAEGHPRQPTQQAPQGAGRIVSTGYFDTVGLKLVRGRFLTDSDQLGASRAIVVNQQMAQTLWPNQDPIGKHVEELADEPTPGLLDPNIASVVVGVVSNTHHDGLGSDFDNEVYLPMMEKNELPVMTILLRSRTDAAETAAGLRRAVAAIDPLVPVTRVRTMDEVVAASTSDSRSLTLLLLGFGFLAVSVGAVGVYSLIAYTVSWRTREIGIRLALGARRRDVVMMIVRQSFLLALGGSVAGLFVAAVSGRLLKQFLFEVSPLDPLTFLSVPLLMMLLALLAAWVPARRAASIDPMKALRTE
ncbi:MAG TPA: ABC transporter permease, partial [Silvibacterium sp.]|nr:ABC transporter permease [Silvibacterium sp.]